MTPLKLTVLYVTLYLSSLLITKQLHFTLPIKENRFNNLYLKFSVNNDQSLVAILELSANFANKPQRASKCLGTQNNNFSNIWFSKSININCPEQGHALSPCRHYLTPISQNLWKVAFFRGKAILGLIETEQRK